MKLEVGADDSNVRLDVWLSRHLPDLSRSRIQSLIREGHVSVDGKQVSSHRKVGGGAEIEIEVPSAAPVELIAEDIPLDVLYEDADIIVVNKPAGLVVHPAAGHASGTLVNALLHHCRDLSGIGGELRPGIVHRLDKDTSGAMVAVKNDQALEALIDQFKNGQVHKEYLAVVLGAPSPRIGHVETLIGRSMYDRKKMAARPAALGQGIAVPRKAGRLALTDYEVVEAFPDCALLKVRIQTGRTHQIRVHMAHLGHPVVGDKQYGKGRRVDGTMHTTVGRQMLHAEFLAFKHPREGRRVEFRAELPADMRDLLEELRRGG